MTHADIIEAAGGASALARAIGADPNTVKQWKRGDSIPAPYWQSIAEADIATLTQLAEAAAAKRLRQAVA